MFSLSPSFVLLEAVMQLKRFNFGNRFGLSWLWPSIDIKHKTGKGRITTHPLSTLFAAGIGIAAALPSSGVSELARVLLVTKDLGLTQLACVASSLLSTTGGVLTERFRSSGLCLQHMTMARWCLMTYVRRAISWSLSFERAFHLPAPVLHLVADAENHQMEVSQE